MHKCSLTLTRSKGYQSCAGGHSFAAHRTQLQLTPGSTTIYVQYTGTSRCCESVSPPTPCRQARRPYSCKKWSTAYRILLMPNSKQRCIHATLFLLKAVQNSCGMHGPRSCLAPQCNVREGAMHMHKTSVCLGMTMHVYLRMHASMHVYPLVGATAPQGSAASFMVLRTRMCEVPLQT